MTRVGPRRRPHPDVNRVALKFAVRRGPWRGDAGRGRYRLAAMTETAWEAAMTTGIDPYSSATAPEGVPTKPYMTIVLPCYNEQDHVLLEIERITTAMEASGYSYELL